MGDQLISEIQRLYPQIYLACHKEHVRASSTKWRLSSYDASILAHLDTDKGISPRALAAHLRVVQSTLSAALKRLSQLGYITIERGTEDRRRRELRLTNLGSKAISSTSVLDSKRLEQLLQKLSQEEVAVAISGLRLLAQAARKLGEEKQ